MEVVGTFTNIRMVITNNGKLGAEVSKRLKRGRSWRDPKKRANTYIYEVNYNPIVTYAAEVWKMR